MKKKIMALCLAAIIAVIAITGITLAYFTDTDTEDNVFTVGNVAIDLTENFDETLAHLIPSTGSFEEGTLKNGVTKEIFVTNTGSEKAYVRVHIAVPEILDEGNASFDAGEDVLHIGYDKNNIGAEKWSLNASASSPYEEGFAYKTEIDGIRYNVYVVTYESVLDKNEKTSSPITQVYLDSAVTNEDVTAVSEVLGGSWHVCVAAEGVQANGFDNAYDALNTAFGYPGSEGYVLPWN